MDNAQKAIMIGVGLFITIIVIAAVMLITGMGQDMLTSGQQQVSSISTSLQAQLKADFDGTTVSGSQLIAAVKRYHTDEGMVILVNATGTSLLDTSKTFNYGKVTANGLYGSLHYGFTAKGTAEYTGSEKQTPIGKLSDPSSSNANYYVPSTAKYHANLIRIVDGEDPKIGTDTVIGIVFQRKN